MTRPRAKTAPFFDQSYIAEAGDFSTAGDPVWHLSTALILLSGSFGILFSLKEWGDPLFSEMVSPGPGQMLLGDSGRMLAFEVGPDGVQSKLMGLPARLIEGFLLTVGSVGVLAALSTDPVAQLLTAAYLPSI